MCVEQYFFFASNGHEYLYSSPLMRKSHVESRKITNQICCSGYIFFKEPECVRRDLYPTESVEMLVFFTQEYLV